MDFIEEGLKRKLIRFEDGEKYIVYLPQNKRRNYENPEEKVQAETFIKLALIYGYPPNRIQQFVPVQMGSETKEADIIVYDDDALKVPLIVPEVFCGIPVAGRGLGQPWYWSFRPSASTMAGGGIERGSSTAQHLTHSMSGPNTTWFYRGSCHFIHRLVISPLLPGYSLKGEESCESLFVRGQLLHLGL